MGYLSEKYIKNDKKKFWIQLMLDVFLIAMLIIVGLSARAEFDNGAKFMLQNVPAFCMNGTLYSEMLDFYNVSVQTNVSNPFASNIL